MPGCTLQITDKSIVGIEVRVLAAGDPLVYPCSSNDDKTVSLLPVNLHTYMVILRDHLCVKLMEVTPEGSPKNFHEYIVQEVGEPEHIRQQVGEGSKVC